MISLQTNVDSIYAQNNLAIDNMNQSQTIQQLTSGYRINSSGDDAAGLAVANGYRNQITQLTQGVMNANNGVSQLQIIDGGLSNISTILNRMQTLATESASGSFTGNRATLNQEYQSLVGEITRQATNINLNAGGSMNSILNVFIGGGQSGSSSNSVSVDLSGVSGAVDATSLGVNGTNVLGGGAAGISGNSVNLNTGTFLGGNNSQTFTFNIYGQANAITATVNGGASGVSGATALASLNSQLNPFGISAGLSSSGTLQFTSTNAFTISAAAATGGGGLTTAAGTTDNTSLYTYDGPSTGAWVAPAATENITFTSGGQSVAVAIATTDTQAQAITAINAKTSALGIYAVANANGNGISFQSANTFTIQDDGAEGAGKGVFGVAAATSYSANAPSGSNSATAVAAISNAIQQLGLVQGRVGAGENLLNYAIDLANSQITNISSAQSQIRDANVAQDAANLTKSQVLVQTAVAALAQANAEPQQVMKLIQNL